MAKWLIMSPPNAESRCHRTGCPPGRAVLSGGRVVLGPCVPLGQLVLGPCIPLRTSCPLPHTVLCGRNNGVLILSSLAVRKVRSLDHAVRLQRSYLCLQGAYSNSANLGSVSKLPLVKLPVCHRLVLIAHSSCIPYISRGEQ